MGNQYFKDKMNPTRNRILTSAVTFLLSSRSHLFPASATTMLGLPMEIVNAFQEITYTKTDKHNLPLFYCLILKDMSTKVMTSGLCFSHAPQRRNNQIYTPCFCNSCTHFLARVNESCITKQKQKDVFM